MISNNPFKPFSGSPQERITYIKRYLTKYGYFAPTSSSPIQSSQTVSKSTKPIWLVGLLIGLFTGLSIYLLAIIFFILKQPEYLLFPKRLFTTLVILILTYTVSSSLLGLILGWLRQFFLRKVKIKKEQE